VKIAIVRLSALGDIIHTAASLPFLRAALPDAHVTWFVEEKFAGILEHHPLIDRIIPLDLHGLKRHPSLALLQENLRRIRSAGPFDKVIDVQGLIKSALVARIAGTPVAGLDPRSAREPLASLLYRERYAVDCAGIAPMRFATLLAQALGFPLSEEMIRHKEPSLHFDATAAKGVLDPFYSDSVTNILLVVGASGAHKTYPPEQWIRVIEKLPPSNVLLVAGSDEERSAAEKIEAATSARLLPPMDLNALKVAVSRSDLLLGGDTGPSHIAWALNRPSILLFGATPPSMMMQTPINLALTADAPVNPCRFDKNDRSIATIPPESIVQNAKKLLTKIGKFPEMV